MARRALEMTKKGKYRADCPTLAKIAAFTGIDVHSNFEVRTAAAKATPAVCATHTTTTTMLPCNLQSIRAGYDAKRKVRTRVEAALPAAQPAGAPADYHKRRRQAAARCKQGGVRYTTSATAKGDAVRSSRQR